MRRFVLLVGLALCFSTVLLAPTASAACSGDDLVSHDCRAAICSTQTPIDRILIDCWGVVGPPI